jgi:hypothetical protein
LTISATRVELTGTTVCTLAPYSRTPPRCSSARRRRRSSECSGREPLVAGIDALGREGEEEIDVRLEALFFEHRLHDFVGGPGVGRGLEDDQLSRLDRGRHRFDREHDVRQIGILGLAQRRRHADVDRVHLAERVHVGGRAELAGFHALAQIRVGTSGM